MSKLFRGKKTHAVVDDGVSWTNEFDGFRAEELSYRVDVHPTSRLTTAEAVPASLTAIHSYSPASASCTPSIFNDPCRDTSMNGRSSSCIKHTSRLSCFCTLLATFNCIYVISGVTRVGVIRGGKPMVSPYFFFKKLTTFLVIASGKWWPF